MPNNITRATAAQMEKARQQYGPQQAEFAQQYNPQNLPLPAEGGVWVGPYYFGPDGQRYVAPGSQGGAGQFRPVPVLGDYAAVAPGTPVNAPFQLPSGINLPGSGGMPRLPGQGQGPGTEGIDLRGDFGRPTVTGAPRPPTFALPRPTTGIPPNLGTPTPFADLPTTPTDDKEKDKPKTEGDFDWGKLVKALLGNSGDIASVLTAAAASRAAARTKEAENARLEDENNLKRAIFSQRSPHTRAGQAAYGDFLANAQDVNISVPGIEPTTVTGGLRPSNLGPNARAAGAELSKQALAKLMSGEDLPPLSERPEANWVDDLLNYSGAGLTGAAIFNRIRDSYANPTRPSRTTVAAPTPVGAAGANSAFGNPNIFQPRR